jgi:hypothetical protein
MSQSFVTVMHGSSGYFAVSMEWDDDAQEYLPDCASDAHYPSKQQAEADAQEWAEADNMRFIP